MSNPFKAGNPPNQYDPKPDIANLSHEEVVSQQQGRCIPWFCGQRTIALTWISPVYNRRRVTSTGAQGAWGKAAQLNPTDIGADVGAASKQPRSVTSYYGSIAGVACLGPIDELEGIIVNGATVWPTRKAWADGVVNLQTIARNRKGGSARLHFSVTHGLRAGNKFIVGGLDDASFDEASPTVIHDSTNTSIIYGNAGADVGLTTDVDGSITKIVHYEVDELVRDGLDVWQCLSEHDGTPDKRPPNPTYWARFATTRGASANPLVITVLGMGDCYLYWGTDDQVLDTVGEQLLAQNGHPPYRRQVVLVLVDFLFDSNGNAPNVQLAMRRKANQTIITGDAAELDSDGQCNPLAAIAEMLCDGVVGIGKEKDFVRWPRLPL
jgi:hypothetical protein